MTLQLELRWILPVPLYEFSNRLSFEALKKRVTWSITICAIAAFANPIRTKYRLKEASASLPDQFPQTVSLFSDVPSPLSVSGTCSILLESGFAPT
jgi:hypothetical protein